MKKKLVLLEPDEDNQFWNKVTNYNKVVPVFVELECEANGEVKQTLANFLIIKEAFFPQVFAKSFGIEEDKDK